MVNETVLESNERTNATVAHVGILLGIVTRGVGGIVLALLILVTQRGKSAYAARQATQALVYQVIGLGLEVLVWILWGLTMAGSVLLPLLADPVQPERLMPFTMIPAFLLMGVPLTLMLLWTVGGLYAAYQTGHGRDFSYPLLGRWIK